jgi:hypothetical protein
MVAYVGARAKARGVKLGRRPKLTPHQKREALERRQRDKFLPSHSRSCAYLPELGRLLAAAAPAAVVRRGRRPLRMTPKAVRRRRIRWHNRRRRARAVARAARGILSSVRCLDLLGIRPSL